MSVAQLGMLTGLTNLEIDFESVQQANFDGVFFGLERLTGLQQLVLQSVPQDQSTYMLRFTKLRQLTHLLCGLW